MPARRVILRSPFVANNILSNVNYKQMVGRAGRAGINQVGESFLFVDENSKKHLSTIFQVDKMTKSYLNQQNEEQLATTIISIVGLKVLKVKLK